MTSVTLQAQWESAPLKSSILKYALIGVAVFGGVCLIGGFVRTYL